MQPGTFDRDSCCLITIRQGGSAQFIALEDRIWFSELLPDALVVLKLLASNQHSGNFDERNLIPFAPNQLNSVSAISSYLLSSMKPHPFGA
jgi:hypothetical protein